MVVCYGFLQSTARSEDKGETRLNECTYGVQFLPRCEEGFFDLFEVFREIKIHCTNDIHVMYHSNWDTQVSVVFLLFKCRYDLILNFEACERKFFRSCFRISK